MSTDRKRLTSAIQRIAREDPEIRKLLDDFRNSGGKPSETASSGSGAEDRQTCCDGSSGGSANPGSNTKDPSEGGQDASDGLNGDDPADISDMGPGSLAGINDCATGEPVCFEGSDWLPPEGWESPGSPPPDPTWEQGIYWYVAWQTPSSSGIDYFATKPSVCGYTGCSLEGANCDGDTWGISQSCDDGSYGGTRYRTACPEPGEDPEVDAVCVDEAPLLDTWPEDGCVNLAQKGGSLVGSKFDPENDGSYSKPRSSIELCDDYGNSFELAPSSSGGWKTISAQNPGDGYLYNSNGQQIARISGSEFSDPNV